MIVNARKEAGIINPETGRYLELDVYLPALKLGFEYQVCPLSLRSAASCSKRLLYLQERHHYLKDTSYSNTSLEGVQKRDRLKQELASKNGITLIIVPCWWDNQVER